LSDRLAARMADAGIGYAANNNNNDVARRPPLPGIRTQVVFTLRPRPVTSLAADGAVLGVGFDGSPDDGSLDRGYEFPPHRGRQFDREYQRPYYESEGEEEY
jgi:hypothetical protein